MREITLLISKIVIIILMCVSGVAHGQTLLDQPIRTQINSQSIEGVLAELMLEEQVNIVFSKDVVSSQLITIDAEEEYTLGELLKHIFYKTPLTYSLIDKQIIIHPIKLDNDAIFTISGFLHDYDSGEPLVGATVFDAESQQGTATNNYGFFSLTLNGGDVDLRYSFIGYSSVSERFFLSENIREKKHLSFAVTLTEVIVESKTKELQINEDISTNTLSKETILELPALGGEKDVIRVAQLLPGVTTGADGLEGIFVRGGSTSQNLVLIDGVPIYYMSHFGGLFSIFNTYSIRSANLIKGAFPARYGGRLSSILDIRTKEGNNKQVKGSFDIGALAATGAIEGPILKNKSSFFVGARKSFLDVYLTPLSQEDKKARGEEGESGYGFFDINGKANFFFSDEDKLFFSFYTGSDALSDESQRISSFTLDIGGDRDFSFHQFVSRQFAWRNRIGSLRWNHLFSDKLFSNTALTYSQLNATSDYLQVDSLVDNTAQSIFDEGKVIESYSTFIKDVGIKLDFDYIPASQHYIKFGLQGNFRTFAPSAYAYNSRTEDGEEPEPEVPQKLYSQSASIWAEESFKNNRWNIDVGLRGTVHSVTNTEYYTFEPRLALTYKASKDIHLNASYSKMTQFLHLLSNTEIGLPTDLWVPSTDKIEPEESDQYVLGANYFISDKSQITVEAFYKKMDKLLDFSEGALLINNWQKNVTQGVGTSKGIEMSYTKQLGKTRGWLAYTYSFTDREFEEINFGEKYPFKYDRRHNIQLAITHRISEKLSLSAAWTFNTGSAFSAPVSKYRMRFPNGIDITTIPFFVYGTKNGHRMPDYHRLDISANWLFPTSWGDHRIQLGINNVYNRSNPLYYQFRSTYISVNGNLIEENDYTQLTLVRLLPSFSYSYSF